MRLILVIFLLVLSLPTHGQWLNGGRKQSQSVQSNGDLLVDDGVMYFFNADNFMQKSTDNGATWIDLADSGLPPKGPGVNKAVSIMKAAGGESTLQ